MSIAFCVSVALVVGYVSDLLFGEHFAAICPAILLGKLIAKLEPPLRARAENDPAKLRRAGRILVVAVCAAAFVPTLVISVAAWLIHPAVFLILQAFWFYQIIATRCLADASLPVYQALQEDDLEKARREVGMIVGRDTTELTAEGCTKAAVETVAENTSDGSIAPLIYFALGAAPLAMLYKAINTMDSMIGYKNEKYLDFGRAAALLDDVANFIPARITGLLLCAAAIFVPGCSPARAVRIWTRDRKKSTSPNSGQCESAVAGALGVALLGDAVYFGKVVHKESVGDATRAIAPADIATSHKLMFAAASIACVLALVIRLLVFGIA